MTDVKYNFDETFTVKNKLTGNSYVNDVDKKKIFFKQPLTGARKLVAEFCVTDLVWNDSNKDIDKITLNGSASTEYTLSSNHAALKNRIFKEAYPSGIGFPASSPDKKFMHFGVNEALYEFISCVVRGIQAGTLPVGKETVTLAITATDTETLTNGTIVVTAKDESNTAVQGLKITGTAGEEEIDGTTDSSGQVSLTVEAAGTYAVSVASAATDAYKAATKTGSVTVTTKEAGGTE